MTFKELRAASGMTQQAFANYFDIPKRTIENWETERRKCPEYLLKLMEYKLKNEKHGKWEFVEEPNTVDTLGRQVYHARCNKCGFIWTDLYSVKNYFSCCPSCGTKMDK